MSMKVHEISREDILVAPNRQRREFDHEKTMELVASIEQVGLIHPIVVRVDGDGQTILVAGERRLKALEYIWEFGSEVKCGEYIYPVGVAPCLMQGEMDPLQAYEMELEENVRRADLSWQDKASATSQLFELRRLQAEKNGEEPPTTASVGAEIYPDLSEDRAQTVTRHELIAARNLDDPDVKKAKTLEEGIKILKRKEETRRNEALGAEIGKSFTNAAHTLLKGDCVQILAGLPNESFDVICTDPPYGMGADEFGDSGGKALGAHFYDDSFESWQRLMAEVMPHIFRVAKAQSHLYMFCDVNNFLSLKSYAVAAGWECFRTPFIWHNPGGFRAPWPEKGPQRRYQTILYGVKGGKNVTRLYGDVLTYGNDTNLGHPAQKPVELLKDLLNRSIRPGDTVLDPFAGSGSIFEAAHALKCAATGIEIDDAAFGVAIKRIGELK